jgi:hypothetical protein
LQAKIAAGYFWSVSFPDLLAVLRCSGSTKVGEPRSVPGRPLARYGLVGGSTIGSRQISNVGEKANRDAARCSKSPKPISSSDGAPEIHPFTRNPDNHLVKMPLITRARTPFPQPSRQRRSELQHPAADHFVGNLEPTLDEERLHVAVTQGETEIEPDRVLDNRWRKAVAAIRQQGHAEMLSYLPVALTPFP